MNMKTTEAALNPLAPTLNLKCQDQSKNKIGEIQIFPYIWLHSSNPRLNSKCCRKLFDQLLGFFIFKENHLNGQFGE